MTHNATQPLLLTVPEVCERLHLSRPTVYDLLNSGKLRSFKVGTARRIPLRALEDFVARQLEAASREGRAPSPGAA